MRIEPPHPMPDGTRLIGADAREIEYAMRPHRRRAMLDALGAAVKEWRGTPYAAGCCSPGPGGGVDCVRFVDAVLQQLHQTVLPPLPRFAQDAAFHNPRTVADMIGILEARYPRYRRRRWTGVLPSDIVLVAYERWENHIGIAGVNPLQIWHATSVGVACTSLDAIKSTGRVQRVYGSEDWR